MIVATKKQRVAARANIKKAAAAAKKKRTIAHLSSGVRTALGKGRGCRPKKALAIAAASVRLLMACWITKLAGSFNQSRLR